MAVTNSELGAYVNSLTEDANPDPASDFLLEYDASAGATKKVKIETLGGGNVPAWILDLPDNPPANPDAMDDEFTDSQLAAKWTELYQAGLTRTISFYQSRLIWVGPAGVNTYRTACIYQNAPAGAWRIRSKMTLEGVTLLYGGIGLFAGVSSGGKRLECKLLHHAAWGARTFDVYRMTNDTVSSEVDKLEFYDQTFYFEIENDLTNIIFRVSASGVEGTYSLVHSETIANFLVSSPDRVGIAFNPIMNSATIGVTTSVDWFRRMA